MEKGWFVFCQAGKYQQSFLTGPDGQPVTRELPRVLGRVRCPSMEPAAMLPKDHNRVVMDILRVFSEEVRHRKAESKHGLSLSSALVSRLQEAFSRPITAALRRQLNVLRRDGVTASPLVRALGDLYHDHGLHEMPNVERRRQDLEAEEWPRIICSEAFQ